MDRQQQQHDRYIPRLERNSIQENQQEASKQTNAFSNNQHQDSSNRGNLRQTEYERRFASASVEKRTLLNMYKFVQNQHYLLTDDERKAIGRVQFSQILRFGACLGLGAATGSVVHSLAKRSVSLPAPPKLTPLLRNPLIRAFSHSWARPFLVLGFGIGGAQISGIGAEKRLLRCITELESPLGAMVRISLRESRAPDANRYLSSVDFEDREDRQRLEQYLKKLKTRKEKIDYEESRVLQNVDDFGAPGYIRGTAHYFDANTWVDDYGRTGDVDEFKLPELVTPDDDLEYHPELLGYDGEKVYRYQQLYDNDDAVISSDVPVDEELEKVYD